MNKDLKNYCIIFIVSTMLIYFAFSFVQWTLNANNWGEDKRGLFIFLCLLFYCFIPLIIISIKKD